MKHLENKDTTPLVGQGALASNLALGLPNQPASPRAEDVQYPTPSSPAPIPGSHQIQKPASYPHMTSHPPGPRNSLPEADVTKRPRPQDLGPKAHSAPGTLCAQSEVGKEVIQTAFEVSHPQDTRIEKPKEEVALILFSVVS